MLNPYRNMSQTKPLIAKTHFNGGPRFSRMNRMNKIEVCTAAIPNCATEAQRPMPMKAVNALNAASRSRMNSANTNGRGLARLGSISGPIMIVPLGRWREKEKPHGVDKAPINSHHFQRCVIGGRYLAAADSPKEHVEDEANAGHQVNGVQARANPVKGPEQLSYTALTGLGLEINDRHDLVLKIEVVLISLEAQKGAPKRRSCNQPQDHSAPIALRG